MNHHIEGIRGLVIPEDAVAAIFCTFVLLLRPLHASVCCAALLAVSQLRNSPKRGDASIEGG